MTSNEIDETVFLLRSAHDAILRECLAWDNVETGTELIGVQMPGGFLVTKALPPGPNARRTPASFSPDVAFVQKELEAYRKDHPGEDFLGIHHQHPPSLNHPSHGDLEQAKTILQDPDYRINGRFLSLISIRAKKKVVLFPYRITSADPVFRRVGLEILSDNNPRAQTLLRQAGSQSSRVQRDQAASFWDDSDFHWYRTRIGKVRLEQEITAIRRQTGILPRVRKTGDGTMLFHLKRLVIAFPREYPLNPPTIFRIRKHGSLSPVASTFRRTEWNSNQTVADLVGGKKYRRFWAEPRIPRLFVGVKRAFASHLRLFVRQPQDDGTQMTLRIEPTEGDQR